MLVLALDTAGSDCAVAIYDTARHEVLAEVSEDIGWGHAERLMAMVDVALGASDVALQDIGRVAVTIGPGSFTGIRVGVAAARGFALALGVEAVGISTLEVLAAEAIDRRRRSGAAEETRPVLVAMDARRGEVYLQLFSAVGRPLEDAVVMPLDEARAIAGGGGFEIVGSAASLLDGGEVADGADRFPIARVARLAVSAKTGRPRPLYLRGPDAKPQTGFAVAKM